MYEDIGDYCYEQNKYAPKTTQQIIQYIYKRKNVTVRKDGFRVGVERMTRFPFRLMYLYFTILVKK